MGPNRSDNAEARSLPLAAHGFVPAAVANNRATERLAVSSGLVSMPASMEAGG